MRKLPRYLKANKAKEVPSTLELAGWLQLQAAELEGTPQKFFLVANTGRELMDLDGFMDPVLINLDGAKFHKKITAVVADHDVRKRIGHTVEQAVIPAGRKAVVGGREFEGPVIVAYGVVSSSMAIAKGFVDDAKAGFPFEVSVGAELIKAEFVEDGQTAMVNGMEFRGPFIKADTTLIRELTITVLGADSGTSATLAATTKKGNAMEFSEYCESLGIADIEALTDDQKTNLKASWQKVYPKNTPQNQPENTPVNQPVTSQGGTGDLKTWNNRLAENEQRIGGIRQVASRFESSVKELEIGGTKMDLTAATAHAIKEDWTANDLELHCRRAERPGGGDGPAVHFKSSDLDNEALTASILRQTGTPEKSLNPVTGREYGLEKMFSAKTLEASTDKRYNIGGSIQNLLDLQIRASGGYYKGMDRGSSDFLAAAVKSWETIKASGFSTLNITNILENTMHKAALAAFEAVEAVWPFITGRRSLNDFRPHNLYRLQFDGSYTQVAPDGELKHISMTDEKFSIQADTFGAMISVDRKTIKNDDLGVVVDQARGLGSLGAQRIEESIFVLILSNPGTFFSAGNNNLLTGAGSALDVTSLNDARQTFRNQVRNGKPVGVSPRILLVGTTLETTANRLWSEEKLEVGGNNADDLVFVNNPHKGLYRPYISPYLNNTDILDQDGNALTGQSDTQWYLLGDPNAPQGAAVVIGFVDGRSTPFFDEAETQFNVPGGIQMRSYLDWGVSMHVTQMAVKSAGA